MAKLISIDYVRACIGLILLIDRLIDVLKITILIASDLIRKTLRICFPVYLFSPYGCCHEFYANTRSAAIFTKYPLSNCTYPIVVFMHKYTANKVIEVDRLNRETATHVYGATPVWGTEEDLRVSCT